MPAGLGHEARLQGWVTRLGCSTQPLGALSAIRHPSGLGGGDGEDFWLSQRPKVFALTLPTPARWVLWDMGGLWGRCGVGERG
jgi:hypothetical protein